ncbi:MAG: hypothetical protein ACJATV_000567 [Granulosicoccus sp.]|jgi:hypothetical protein
MNSFCITLKLAPANPAHHMNKGLNLTEPYLMVFYPQKIKALFFNTQQYMRHKVSKRYYIRGYLNNIYGLFPYAC